ncbi:hypothetical protein M0R45_005532 [Rubus argutus]|uniref:Uncharacterized protein n=1 Tax=Rubus argutus TaxID=59490 RepID=A0AAW1YN33_RUBAR
MTRTLVREFEEMLVQLVTVTKTEEVPEMPIEISKVLQQYEEVFEVPTTLPPERKHDHRITLALVSAPINVRPYKHAHYQKNEIEKIVKELVAT